MSENLIHFYQTGTYTVGNRLLSPEERSGQAMMDRNNSLTSGHRACQGCIFSIRPIYFMKQK